MNQVPGALEIDRPRAWVMCDQETIRQSILNDLGFQSLHFGRDLHTKSQFRLILNQAQAQPPCIVWIRVGGPAAGTGNRHDNVRAQNLVHIANQHIGTGGVLILEANKRSLVWSLRFIQDLVKDLFVTEHSWCWHEVASQYSGVKCNTVVRVATNVSLNGDYGCTCPDPLNHVNAKQMSKDQMHQRSGQVLRSICRCILQRAQNGVVSSLIQTRLHRQPESSKTLNHSRVFCSEPPIKESITIRDHGSCSVARRAEHRDSPVVSQRVDVSYPSSHMSTSTVLELLDARAKVEHDRADYSFKTCLSLLKLLPFETGATRRQSVASHPGESSCQVLGLYKYGGFKGVTSLSHRIPNFCIYLNGFAKHHRASGCWTSISINRNAQLEPHWDYGNLVGTVNQLIGLGSYKGGELWLQLLDHEVDAHRNVQWMVSNRSEAMPGTLLSCKHRMVQFEPQRYHGTMPWEGERHTLAIYTNRALLEVDTNTYHKLISLGFPLGAKEYHFRSNSSEHLSHQDFSDSYESHCLNHDLGVLSFPTEQAVRQKERLREAKLAGKSPKKRLQTVEQID